MPEVAVEQILAAYAELRDRVAELRFSAPVAYVYNPLDYAWEPFRRYVQRYGAPPKEVLLLGMNPGPFGMVQTGIPFGAVSYVRDWLGIDGPVGKPAREHPKRPVVGFAIGRDEVSGRRLWGWAAERFGTPARFFARFFVANYCPLAFLEASGRNRTPDKLPKAERKPLFVLCDTALRTLVAHQGPRWVVGIGRFATERARAALAGLPVMIGTVPHPSPANPAANRGWRQAAETALTALGIPL